MLAKINSATLQGLTAVHVTVEVDSREAVEKPHFTIVGLPDNAVKESQERVMTALRANQFNSGLRVNVVNLAPADLRKEGSGLDLPIAVGLICAYGQLDMSLPENCMFVGELGLDGSIQPIKGALPIAIKARAMKVDALFVPEANAREAAVVNQLKVYGVRNLMDVVDILRGISDIRPTEVRTREEFYAQQYNFENDFSEVKGQENVKRAFEVAAAGGHNIIKISPILQERQLSDIQTFIIKSAISRSIFYKKIVA